MLNNPVKMNRQWRQNQNLVVENLKNLKSACKNKKIIIEK